MRVTRRRVARANLCVQRPLAAVSTEDKGTPLSLSSTRVVVGGILSTLRATPFLETVNPLRSSQSLTADNDDDDDNRLSLSLSLSLLLFLIVVVVVVAVDVDVEASVPTVELSDAPPSHSPLSSPLFSPLSSFLSPLSLVAQTYRPQRPQRGRLLGRTDDRGVAQVE